MELSMKNSIISYLRQSGEDLAVRSGFLTSSVGPGLDAARGMADACTIRAGRMTAPASDALSAGMPAA